MKENLIWALYRPSYTLFSNGRITLRTIFVLSFKQTNKQTNKLYLTRVTLNSEITDKPVALGFQIELELINETAISYFSKRRRLSSPLY